MAKKELRIRCWIDIDEERFFGPGRAELLGLIEEEGSISKAAKRMGMSYKKAWDMIDHMNRVSKKPLVTPRKGGEKGGGADVTPAGKEIVARYLAIAAKLNAVLEKERDILKLI